MGEEISAVRGTSNRTQRRRIQQRVLELINDSTPDQRDLVGCSGAEPIVSDTYIVRSELYDSNNSSNAPNEGGIETDVVESLPSCSSRPSPSLESRLYEWHCKNNISITATSELLKLLKHNTTEGRELPSDARTLLNTPRHTNVQKVSGGELVYFGISTYFKMVRLSRITTSPLPFLSGRQNHLSISVGIDGIPLSKSSRLCFWPILGKCDQIREAEIFIIALYQGQQKPNDITEFLKEFVSEASLLEQNGILIEGTLHTFEVSCIVADAPARAFVKQCKIFNAFHGCERCLSEGVYDGRVIHLDYKAPLRTKQSLLQQCDLSHHVGLSPLSQLNIDLVLHVPLDYMHSVCLGVMRKLLFGWVYGKGYFRWNTLKVSNISKALISLKRFIPSEFSRKTRSLRDLRNYKATEYRLFLLFTGMAVLKDVLSSAEYRCYLLLHCAMYILLSDSANDPSWNSLAKELLLKFVKLCNSLYGQTFIVYNMHSLLHIADDGLTFGSLDNCSAFPFENYMQILKSLVRKRSCQLVQVSRRIHERKIYAMKVSEMKVESSNDIRNIKSDKILIKGILVNNCFLTRDCSVVIVKSIFSHSLNLIKYANCCVCKKKAVDGYPIDSAKLFIFEVEESTELISLALDELMFKCVLLPIGGRFLCIPYTKKI